ncbi:hypothetical protein OIU77_022093 [Salix suchowensis]|uniref:Malonyl-CoA decarboxylase C-terminal domain-containing protein n=1 Tax=Salix suchowensis TaxID=1278906 RepID=A0ABQ9CFA3_9ROSI|nr:hypothetical protein OIU77_022093 [Salix suchowensis]
MRPGNDPSKLSSFSPLSNEINQMMTDPPRKQRSIDDSRSNFSASGNHYERNFDIVKESMGLAISLNKTESLDVVLDDFSEGYFSLSNENRKKLVTVLAKEYDLNRIQVRELLKQYLGLELRSGNEGESSNVDDENMFSTFYRIERNLRQALKPTYNAVHPISNLLDLKRRLGVGRRCFGYFHPAIPGEPLIFIEVALLKNVAQTIQEVLLDVPSIPEHEAACALFYSISSTQPGLAGINLGKFLIKRMITLVKRDMPQVSTFATLSPIPGFMQWLLSKLASQSVMAKVDNMEQPTGGPGSAFQENLLEPDEERMLKNSSPVTYAVKNGMEVMLNLLTSKNYEWTSSAELLSALKPPLMRLCARYLLQEKKRGKALDSVANFHLQNGAMVERLNWMADRSEKGLHQSGGIMVNYVYRLEYIEQYAQSYFSTGHIHASCDIRHYIMKEPEETTGSTGEEPALQ